MHGQFTGRHRMEFELQNDRPSVHGVWLAAQEVSERVMYEGTAAVRRLVSLPSLNDMGVTSDHRDGARRDHLPRQFALSRQDVSEILFAPVGRENHAVDVASERKRVHDRQNLVSVPIAEENLRL